LLIDPDRVREGEGVKVFADLAHKTSVGREFQKLRRRCAERRTGRVSTRINKHMLFRVHGNTGDLAEIHVLRQAHCIGNRLIGNHRHRLRENRRRQQQPCKT